MPAARYKRISRICLLLCLSIGLVTATYLLVATRTNGDAGVPGCYFAKQHQCAKVLHGPYSEFLGVDLVLLGVGFYLILLFVVALYILTQSALTRVTATSILTLGVSVSAYLVVLMMRRGEICSLCIAVHSCNFVMFTSWWRASYQQGVQRSWIQIPVLVTLSVAVFFALSVIHRPRVSYAESGVDVVSRTDSGPEFLNKSPGPVQSTASHPEANIDSQAILLTVGNGPVEVRVFLDFTCAKCRKLCGMFRRISEQSPATLKLQFHFLPLEEECNPLVENEDPEHQNACATARLAYRVGDTSEAAFERFHQRMLETKLPVNLTEAFEIACTVVGKRQLESENVVELAQRCLQRDISLAIDLGIEQLPAIVVNGRLYQGCPERESELRVVLFPEEN